MRVKERYELGKLVTFELNRRLPIYNWFHFKEGFSRSFVMLMFDWLNIREGCWVLDPFCGVGTTLLAAKERGLNAVGVDAHPVFAFISKVKTRDYDIRRLKESVRSLFSVKFTKLDFSGVNPILRKAFSKYALEDIVFFKSEIGRMEDHVIRDFFMFTLMVAAMKVSYAVKDGAVIRFFKKEHPPLRRVFKATVKRFIKDLGRFHFEPCEVAAELGDARRLNLRDGSFDAVVTSPPYLNKIEYTKAYAVEEALLTEPTIIDLRKRYLGLDITKAQNPFPRLKLPDIAKAYFSDIKLCLQEMYRVLRNGGKVALVVGQGVFPDGVIESDVLIAKLAEGVGFDVKERLIVNRRVATQERTVKIGVALESILVMAR